MNRTQFLQKLRDSLSGLPQTEIDEIVADYDSHFVEAVAAGGSEEDVAAALGEPARLAKELKAEAGFKRLEQKPTPKNAVLAISAFLGLLTFNVLILLPIAIALIGVLFGFAVAIIAVFGVGAAMLVGSVGGHGVAISLAGAGLMFGAFGVGLLWLLAMGGVANLAVRYGRLNYKVLKPALDE